MSQRCSHGKIVADLWSALSFVFLKKSKISARESLFDLLPPCEDDSESLLELLSACEEPRLGLNQLKDGTVRRRDPLQDEDHPGNDPHFVPGFPRCVFRNVPETILECVRICGLTRNSFNLNRARKMRDLVLLNLWDRFLMTLPSISSRTCVMYSSFMLGTDVFLNWPFPG